MEMSRSRATVAKTPEPRLTQLDGLRGLAVLSVLVHHTWSGVTRGHGVTVFFVLSGFLITGILLDLRGRPNAMGVFYARRFLRIFPLYYAVVLGAAALGQPAVRETLVWTLSYLTNIRMAFAGPIGRPLDHFWSLAVEEQFYVIWPALVLFLPRRALPWLFAAACCCGPLSRSFLASATGMNPATANMVTPSCLDALAAGALLAYWPNVSARRTRLLGGLGLAGIAACGLAAWADLPGSDFRHVLEGDFVILATIAVVHAAAQQRARWLAFGPLVYVGVISYGVYVYHEFVQLSPLGRLPLGPARFLLVTAGTLAVASVSWFLFEKPINDLKRHVPYRLRARAAEPRRSPQIEPGENFGKGLGLAD